MMSKISKAIEATIVKFDMFPRDINRGSCFDFATVVFDLVEGSKIAGHNRHGCGHTYIEYKGRCYDAEAPQGVKRWQSLPFFKRLT